MKITRCKLSKKAQRRLLEFFTAGVTARTAADLLDIQPNTAALFYHKIRLVIDYHLSLEADECERRVLSSRECRFVFSLSYSLRMLSLRQYRGGSEPLLSPLNIQHQSEFRMLSILQNRVRDLRKDTPEDWQWFIDVCRQKLTRTTASVSSLRSKEPDLVCFIEIAQTMLPAKSWLVSGVQEVIFE